MGWKRRRGKKDGRERKDGGREGRREGEWAQSMKLGGNYKPDHITLFVP